MPTVSEVQQLLPNSDVTTTWNITTGAGGPSHFGFVNDNVDSPDNFSRIGTRTTSRNERHGTADPVTPTANHFAFNHRVTSVKWRAIFQADFNGATDITLVISWFIDGSQQPVRTFLMTFGTNQLIESNFIVDVPLEDFFNLNMRTRADFGFGFTATTFCELTEWQLDATITSDVPALAAVLDAPLPQPRLFHAGFLNLRYASIFDADMHTTATLDAPISIDIVLPAPIPATVTLEAPIVLTITLESPIPGVDFT